MADPQRLLVVDDDPGIGDLIVQVADGLGFRTKYVGRSTQILDAIGSFGPHLIVLDLMMPGSDGVQVLRALAETSCTADIILFSGADARVLNTAARLGESHGLRVRDILQKPIELGALQAALQRFEPVRSSEPEDDLRLAISSREIQVHFQPKVTLLPGKAWRVNGVEALARWHHPTRGMVPPSEFVSLAEKVGLIGDLTDLVLDLAVQKARVMQDNGHTIDIAVNLSPLVLADPEAPDRICRTLAKHGVRSSRLVVEITESAAMGDGTLTMENLTRFRLKDMKLSMDDFGTGFSSLVQLYRMPFSELKVDKSFVMDVDFNEEARAVVRSIVDLAHNLNLTACAEGVETPGTLEFLRSIGCDQVQGYLISKPLDFDGLARFLTDHSPGKAAGSAIGPSAA